MHLPKLKMPISPAFYLYLKYFPETRLAQAILNLLKINFQYSYFTRETQTAIDIFYADNRIDPYSTKSSIRLLSIDHFTGKPMFILEINIPPDKMKEILASTKPPMIFMEDVTPTTSDAQTRVYFYFRQYARVSSIAEIDRNRRCSVFDDNLSRLYIAEERTEPSTSYRNRRGILSTALIRISEAC